MINLFLFLLVLLPFLIYQLLVLLKKRNIMLELNELQFTKFSKMPRRFKGAYIKFLKSIKEQEQMFQL
jgi:hypothetical protein